MNTKQLISELNSECILTKLEKKEITELLEENVELKKYKKILEEFDDLYGHFDIIPLGTSYHIYELMDKIKDKYFPK